MTAWYRGPLLAFDFETGGVDPTETFAVSVAICRVQPGEGVVTWGAILHPGDLEIPHGAANVHGITTERARTEGQPRRDVLDKAAHAITEHLAAGHPLIAYNAAYDVTLLEHELVRHQLPTVTARLGRPIAPVIDPFVIDKHLEPFRKGKRTLEVTAAHYGIQLAGAHDAGFDAAAAAQLAWRIADRHPEIGGADPLELHTAQQVWRKEQCDSLRAYFDKKGQQHDGVDPSWPLRHTPLLEVAA